MILLYVPGFLSGSLFRSRPALIQPQKVTASLIRQSVRESTGALLRNVSIGNPSTAEAGVAAGGRDKLAPQSIGTGNCFREQTAAQEPASAGITGGPELELSVCAGRGNALLPAAAHLFVCLAAFPICLCFQTSIAVLNCVGTEKLPGSGVMLY